MNFSGGEFIHSYFIPTFLIFYIFNFTRACVFTNIFSASALKFLDQYVKSRYITTIFIQFPLFKSDIAHALALLQAQR